jgi:5-methyltetrahydropteroyltriglutamate--homocysteine methyltransferase
MADLIATTVVGSYPQPEWLVDREQMLHEAPPRIGAHHFWRVDDRFLEQAQDDATLLAIRAMERAGIDIITDGEVRRESYSNRFANALEGIDLEHPGSVAGRGGSPTPVPRVVGPIRRARPVEVRDVQFLRAHTDRQIKITIPGPFTMAAQAQNDYYPDQRSLALDYATAVNEEIRELKAAGADVIQLDEPWLQSRVEQARSYALEAINRALAGIDGPTALHTCFGYAYISRNKPDGYPFFAELNDCAVQQVSIEAAQPKLDLACLAQIPSKTVILGVLDLADPQAESPEIVAERIRRALAYVSPERLIVAPDCGMKYLPRDLAFAKLQSLAEGARIVRAEIG